MESLDGVKLHWNEAGELERLVQKQMERSMDPVNGWPGQVRRVIRLLGVAVTGFCLTM